MNGGRSATSLLSRRGLLAAGSFVGALAAGPAFAADGSDKPAPSPLETANEALVTRFCLAWASRDIDQLVPYLSDKLVYQMFEKRPDIVGLEEFRRELTPFLSDLARVEWEILRTFSVGQIVINERVDHFIAKPGGRSMHFEIAGLFVVNDNKIQLWRDYRLEGSKPRMEIEKSGVP